MGKLKGVEGGVRGSPLRPRRIIMCVRWYSSFKLSRRDWWDDGRERRTEWPAESRASDVDDE